MTQVKDIASLCYFNYAYSGERVGRALGGMEFDIEDDQQACLARIMSMQTPWAQRAVFVLLAK